MPTFSPTNTKTSHFNIIIALGFCFSCFLFNFIEHFQDAGGSHENTSSSGEAKMTEHQVAKLMEEDMGSAMQYLQGKGLCLMPISLATTISTATCPSRSPFVKDTGVPLSPNLSTTIVANGNGSSLVTVKDAPSVSKP